jgi:hypothetical protein
MNQSINQSVSQIILYSISKFTCSFNHFSESSTQSSTTQPSNSGTLRIIRDRIEAYNKYALKYQRSGDQTTAAKYLNVIKGLRSLEEKVIKGEKIGKFVFLKKFSFEKPKKLEQTP